MDFTASLRLEYKRFDELTLDELYQVLQAREAVFVLEQQCACQDVDGLDKQAWHILAYVEDNATKNQHQQQDVVAYARVLPAGVHYTQPAIGRVLTLKAYRGKQIGRQLMQAAIRFTQSQFNQQGIKISAQAYLQDFYTSLGFMVVGEPYLEGNILHIEMVMPA